MSTPKNYIGSSASILTDDQIRYEGTLSKINQQEKTVILTNGMFFKI